MSIINEKLIAKLTDEKPRLQNENTGRWGLVPGAWRMRNARKNRTQGQT